VMVYTGWSFPDHCGPDGWFLKGFRQILTDYEAHTPGDQYLFIEFDDLAQELRGFSTGVARRGPKTFRMRALGALPYPRRWDPKHR